ncbi:MAG: hypothetical protein VKL39_03355 [Leptolyngbyaceae bacterium]|nr:hypothetical protein [Leptolyngbyaceae bacterium]
MLVSFPVLSKVMADTLSDKASSDSNQPFKQSSPSETADLFNVFPDGQIMWDDINTAKQSEPSSSSALTNAESKEPHHSGAMPPYSDSHASFSPPQTIKSNEQAVQYHVHYHRTNGHKLLGAFLAGGILVFLGFLFFSTHPQALTSPESSEQSKGTGSVSVAT